ncbi:uncharacterized protein BDZ83DRAFT_786104 [Colletotrichum acutatum]|uniref:MYND-type domain-containing protein n=1 Tax=Glomerella acutata TaxID=27357 RepID=A0AAD8XBR7_GLOAC|nr:uncharacterized protein BDZ83DRAFT_786104 [Colletotrichum acutatum]KAK1719363.1 hypothetical protein BDZ83DRAFT_786104 [Colletotrichum acutatum]
MPIPDFANEAIFPIFEGLPIEEPGAADPPSYAASSEPPSYAPAPSDPPSYTDSQSGSGTAKSSASSSSTAVTRPPASSHDAREEWFLIAQVKQNMTITKPTLVVVDRQQTEFAVTFEDRGIDLRPVKGGWTIVVPRGVRTAPKGGKRGFVRVSEGKGTGVKYIPGGLEQIGELGARVREDGGRWLRECAGCGKGAGEGETLKSCTACVVARYCGKECQKEDWKKHKGDCKVLKGMANAWGI